LNCETAWKLSFCDDCDNDNDHDNEEDRKPQAMGADWRRGTAACALAVRRGFVVSEARAERRVDGRCAPDDRFFGAPVSLSLGKGGLPATVETGVRTSDIEQPARNCLAW